MTECYFNSHPVAGLSTECSFNSHPVAGISERRLFRVNFVGDFDLTLDDAIAYAGLNLLLLDRGFLSYNKKIA